MVMDNVTKLTYRSYSWKFFLFFCYRIQDNDPLFLHRQYNELRAEREDHTLEEVFGGRLDWVPAPAASHV